MAAQLPVRLVESIRVARSLAHRLATWPPFVGSIPFHVLVFFIPPRRHGASFTVVFLRYISPRPFIFRHDKVVHSNPRSPPSHSPVKARKKKRLVTAHCCDYFNRTISLSCCSSTLIFARPLFLANVCPSSSRFEPVFVCACLSACRASRELAGCARRRTDVRFGSI